LKILNGGFRDSNGNYTEEFFEIVDTLSKDLMYAVKHTVLPEKPNIKEEVREFVYNMI